MWQWSACGYGEACRTRAMVVLLVLLGCEITSNSTAGTTKDTYNGNGVQVTVTHNGTILPAVAVVNPVSSPVDPGFSCTATYPVEWVADLQYMDPEGEYVYSPWAAWSQRNENGGGAIYKSYLELHFTGRKTSECSLVCRAVGNHSDSILVKFRENLEQLNITQERRGPEAAIGWHEPNPTENDCKFKFEVAETKDGYFWRCESAVTREEVTVQLAACFTSSWCANWQRSTRVLPKCVTRTRNYTIAAELSSDLRWSITPMGAVAGVARCQEQGPVLKGRFGSVEYFLVTPKTPGALKSLHLSLSEIPMQDLIWLDPVPNDVYYLGEKFNTCVFVSRYGLSYYPNLQVTRNGEVLQSYQNLFAMGGGGNYVFKNLTIDAQEYGPVLYEIRVTAPVWNTTELVNHTTQISIRDPIPPYFVRGEENVTVRNGDTNKRLTCDAEGAPIPQITWKYTNLPEVREEGRELVFRQIQAEFHDQISVRCLATNRFGESASKTFKISVEMKPVELLTPGDLNPSTSTATIATIVITVSLGVVAFGGGITFLYLKLLRVKKAIQSSLTDDEVKEFLEGKIQRSASGENSPDLEGLEGYPGTEEPVPLPIDFMPYNSKFELSEENLVVDFSTELGSGHFGVVYKGQALIENGDVDGGFVCVDVAVKTVRPNVPIEYFKALMSELKILAYIGRHENIANLVGAYSGNIKNRELYVGIELCKISLQQYLRANCTTFQPDSLPVKNAGNHDYRMSAIDLIRWTTEIAAGMEFLARKHVVHSDLAVRNILLTVNLHAKISDFGLARQLVDYSYTKQSKEALPWKWMAIESLAHMHFSTASDIWAFGITCWEIFSLGAVPYPCMAWSPYFLEQLVAGTRLCKPAYASDSIFRMMLKCWSLEMADRPKFGTLKQFFSAQLVGTMKRLNGSSHYILAP